MLHECFTLLLKYRFGLRLGSQDGSRCVHCGKPADAEAQDTFPTRLRWAGSTCSSPPSARPTVAYGGFAPEFVALLKKLAGHWGNRSGLPQSRAVQLVMQQFSLTLAKNFASLVLAPNARSCGDSIAALRNATGPAAATARPALPALDVMAFGTRSADSDDDANVVEDFAEPSYRQYSVTSSTSWSMPRDLVERLSSSLARASSSAA